MTFSAFFDLLFPRMSLIPRRNRTRKPMPTSATDEKSTVSGPNPVSLSGDCLPADLVSALNFIDLNSNKGEIPFLFIGCSPSHLENRPPPVAVDSTDLSEDQVFKFADPSPIPTVCSEVKNLDQLLNSVRLSLTESTDIERMPRWTPLMPQDPVRF